MAITEARKTSSQRAATAQYDNVACPFCGLLCDDLKIERKGDALKVLNTDCVRAISGFERKLPSSSPMVRGKKVSLDEAVDGRCRAHQKGQTSPLWRAHDRCRRHARRHVARRSHGRRGRPRLERGAVPQSQSAADQWLDHLDFDRGAQPRRSDHHGRRGRAKIQSALLRARRVAAGFDVRPETGRSVPWCFSARLRIWLC